MIAPWLKVRETCDWQCHIGHHIGDLGDDFEVPEGTPIPAPFDGVVRNVIRQESPVLYIAYITSDANPAVQVEFMHLSKFAPPGRYKAGQTMGWSGGAAGAVGSGHASGPHLHVNAVVNGVLTPIRDILSEFASVGPVIPVTDPTKGNKMRLLGPYGNPVSYLLEVEGTGAFSLPDQGHADIAFRYLNSSAPSAADIAGFYAILATKPVDATWSPSSGAVTIASQPILDAIAAAEKAELAGMPASSAAAIAALASSLGADVAAIESAIAGIKIPSKVTSTLS